MTNENQRNQAQSEKYAKQAAEEAEAARIEERRMKSAAEIKWIEFRKQQASMGNGTPEEMPEGWSPKR